MLTKLLTFVAAFITAVHACDNAGALSTNPMTAPSADNWPTIGQPFTVEWSTDYPNLSPEVTLSLYQITGACPGSACVELADIAGFYTNNGSFTWTPSSSLTAGNNYAILFINENPCLTVWGAAFGLHPAGYTAGSGASSLAAAAAALVTNEASAPASTGAGTAASTTAAGAAAVVPSAAQSSGSAGGPRTTIRYTTVYTTTTMYATGGMTPTAAASGNPSVTVVTVTDTTTIYQSGFSFTGTTTAS